MYYYVYLIVLQVHVSTFIYMYIQKNCIYVKHKVIYTISEVNLIFPDLNNF